MWGARKQRPPKAPAERRHHEVADAYEDAPAADSPELGRSPRGPDGSAAQPLGSATSLLAPSATADDSVREETAWLNQLLAKNSRLASFFVSEKEFNPFLFWREDEVLLKRWSEQVEQAVDKVANDRREAFNAATGHFGKIAQSVMATQRDLSGLQSNCREARRILGARNQNLQQLWLEHEKVRNVLEILQKVDYLRSVPGQLRGFLVRRQFLHAVVLVRHAIELTWAPDVGALTALDDLRHDLAAAKSGLAYAMADELHSHLYLRYRWRSVSENADPAPLPGLADRDPWKSASWQVLADAWPSFAAAGDDEDTDDEDGDEEDGLLARGLGPGSGGPALSSAAAVTSASFSGAGMGMGLSMGMGMGMGLGVGNNSNTLLSAGLGGDGALGGGPFRRNEHLAQLLRMLPDSLPGVSHEASMLANSPFSESSSAARSRARRGSIDGDAAEVLTSLDVMLAEEAKEDYVRDPQSSHSLYTNMLIASLIRLDGLAVAINRLRETMRADLHQLVERETERMRALAARRAGIGDIGASSAPGASSVAAGPLGPGAAPPLLAGKGVSAGGVASLSSSGAPMGRWRGLELGGWVAVGGSGNAHGGSVSGGSSGVDATEIALSSPGGPGASSSPSVAAASSAGSAGAAASTVGVAGAALSAAAQADLLLQLARRVFVRFLVVLHNATAMRDVMIQMAGLQLTESEVTDSKPLLELVDRFSVMTLWELMQEEVQRTLSLYLGVPAGGLEAVADDEEDDDEAFSAGGGGGGGGGGVAAVGAHPRNKRSLFGSLGRRSGAAVAASLGGGGGGPGGDDDGGHLTFSFADSRLPSFAKMSRDMRQTVQEEKRRSQDEQLMQARNAAWIAPSAYYTTALFGPTAEFCQRGVDLLHARNVSELSVAHPPGGTVPRAAAAAARVPVGSGPAAMGTAKAAALSAALARAAFEAGLSRLRAFIDRYVATVFFKRVQMDTTARVVAVLDGPAAFVAQDMRLVRVSVAGSQVTNATVVRAAVDVANVVQSLFVDMNQLPSRSSRSQYLRIVEGVVRRFVDKCDDRFSGLTPGKASALRARGEPAVARIYASDPLYPALDDRFLAFLRAELDPSKAPEMPTDPDQFFAALVGRVHGAVMNATQTVDEEGLVTVVKTLGSVAVLGESLRWLAERLMELADLDAGVVVVGGGGGDSSKTAESDPRKQVAASTAEMAASLLRLSDRCLFMIRLEIELHCFFYLSSMTTHTYACSEPPSQAEPFVSDLNKFLNEAHSEVSQVLSPAKVGFLFENLGRLISAVVIRSFTRLQDLRLNRNGVDTISRNLYAMQQCLTNLVTADTLPFFETARAYYELALLPEPALLAYESQNPHAFTREEYQVLHHVAAPRGANAKPGKK